MSTPKAKKRPFLPSVLIVKEKHGNYYFDCPSEHYLHAAALAILTGRSKDKNCVWYSVSPAPKKPDYTDAVEIAQLRGPSQGIARSNLRRYNEEMQAHQQEKEQFAAIKEAIKKRDGEAAWRILCERSDAEYEEVVLESFDTKYGTTPVQT